jgi:hypothetical protein
MNAREFAQLCDPHIAQLWRDGAENPLLSQGWLERRWVADRPAEPNEASDATIVLTGGGAGIRRRADGRRSGRLRLDTAGRVLRHDPSRRRGIE